MLKDIRRTPAPGLPSGPRGATSATGPTAKKSRYLLTDRNPNDKSKWDSKLAWRTPWITTHSLILAFCVWFLPSMIAPKLTALGFHLDKSQLYWLTAFPDPAAGILRLIYMFLPPLIGTRRLMGITSLLCIIPMAGRFRVIQDSTTPCWVLLTLAFMRGISSGAFSGYMPSIGYSFPKRLASTALGLQDGISNLSMSVILSVGPVLMSFGLFGLTWLAPQQQVTGDHVDKNIWVYNVAIFLAPWCILAVILAFIWLRDVPVKANLKQQSDIFSSPNTQYMAILYVITFGLFSGFSAVFALLINNQFGDQSALNLDVKGTTCTFLGPLIGPFIRVSWGIFCDRMGGTIWALISGVGMTITIDGVAWVLTNPTGKMGFYIFLSLMLTMFLFSGFGNTGISKQVPMIMSVRQADDAIGFIAAIASLGPFLIGVALSVINAPIFFAGYAIFCALCAILCWIMYARKNAPFPG